eukprot:g695.t1
MSAFTKARQRLRLQQQQRKTASANVPTAELEKIVVTLRENVLAKTRKGHTPRRTVEIAFRNVDVDRSGDVEFSEFAKGMAPYLQGIKEGVVRALFDYFDEDGSNILSVNEFIACMLGDKKVKPRAKNTSPSESKRNSSPSRGNGFLAGRSKARKAPATKSAVQNAPFYRGDEPVSRGDKSGSSQEGRQKESTRIVDRIKQQIVERGGTTGIHGVSRIMKVMDDSGDRKLSKEELKYGLKDFKVNLADDDIDTLFAYFDTDGNGSIDFDEFLLGLAGPLNERREKLVLKAFDVMDKTGDGVITIDDLAGVYDVSLLPDVVSGKISEADALKHLLDAFDSANKDGIVTKDEFKTYYRNIGAAIESDDYFELMIRNAWHISGGKGNYQNTTCRRVLVTHEDGRQSVEEITDDLGIAADDIKTMKAILRKRGIKAVGLKTFGAAGKAGKSKHGKKSKEGKDRTFGRPPAAKRVSAPGAAAAPFANDHQSNGRRPSSRQQSSRQAVNSSRGSSASDRESVVSSRISTPRPTGPLPDVWDSHRLLKRLRQEVILRGQGREKLLTTDDRLQYHISAMQIEIGKKILKTVCDRYGNHARLRRRDFGFVLRAFTENGTKPMTDEEVTSLWRSTNGGNKTLLSNLLFPPRGHGSRSRPQKQDGRTAEEYEALLALQYEDDERPVVLQGPFDQGHYGERVVKPISKGEVPQRMKYRYSRTSVQPPSGWDPADMARSAKTPDADLELEWVYGCNGRSPHNFHLSAAGELVYNIAAVVVVYDPKKNTQRHFINHDDDITVLTLDRSRKVAASGQLGANPRVVVWSIETFEIFSVVGSGGFFHRAVCAVSFLGNSSSYICGIGSDDHHAIGIWKWKLSKSEQEGLEIHGLATKGEPTPGKFIAESGCQNGAPPQVFGIIVPTNASSLDNSRKVMKFATVGCNHTKFWTLDLNMKDRLNPLLVKNSRYGKANRLPRKTFCGKYIDGGARLLTGGSNGLVYLFDVSKGECIQSFQAHRGPVYSIDLYAYNASSTTLLTGGADAEAKRWRMDRASRGTKEFSVNLIAHVNLSGTHGELRAAQQRQGPAHNDTIIAPGGSTAAPMFKTTNSGAVAPFHTEQKNADDSGKNKGAGRVGPDVPAGSSHGVRTFALSKNSGEIYCTTSRGDIWSLKLADENKGRPKSAAAFGRPSREQKSKKSGKSSVGSSAKVISRSHYGPVYGLARHPTNHCLFATVGEDKQLSLWDGSTRAQLCAIVLPDFGRSCHFSPDGKSIAVGLLNGAFLVYAYHKATSFRGDTLAMLKSVHDCREAIDDLKYSPNGQYLAVASHDNFVDVYDVRSSYDFITRCKGHTSYITHIDWSRDSRILQSNCGAYEIIYWDMPSGAPLRSTLDKVEADTDWYSWTCVLGFSVMGIWPEYSDGTDVNSLHKTSDGKYVVTADDFGQVKVFNAPCVVQHAPCNAYNGHSSHVMNVRFLLGDESVVSVGGWDCGVFQWKFLRTGIESGRPAKWKPLTAWRNA